MAGSAASTGCSAVAAAPRSTISSPTALVSILRLMRRASAPIRARWRALPSSKPHSPRYAPSGELRSLSSPPIPRRARMPAGPGGMSRSLRYPTDLRSPPPAPPTMRHEPARRHSADLPSHRRAHPGGGDQPFACGVEHQGVVRREADADGFTHGMRRDRAVLEDPQVPDIGVDDIKDLAPHRLHLRDPPAEA